MGDVVGHSGWTSRPDSSAGVVAHRFTDLGEPLGGGALASLVLLLHDAALLALGMQFGCAD